MRKIDKDFNNIPTELQNCASKNETNLLETKKIKANCYKKSKEQLEKQFHKKCAYCETEYITNSDTWIEHYRPKSEYYWLAYDWSNLLPTCTKCNRSKSAKFPLINGGEKVNTPPIRNGQLRISQCKADKSPLIDEKPYILHPKIDEPKKYFDFKIDENYTGIEIIGTDNEGNRDIKKQYTGKGQATIEICDLNRIDLKEDRYRKVVREVVNSFEKMFKFLKENNIPLDKYYDAFKIDFENIVEQSNNDSLEHTLLRQIILDTKKFDNIVCSSIKNNDNLKRYISTAYKKYQNEN